MWNCGDVFGGEAVRRGSEEESDGDVAVGGAG